MYHIVESRKTFTQAAQDLEQSVRDHGFGVLHVHDLGSTLRSKGIEFTEECKVFEVCNPTQAGKSPRAVVLSDSSRKSADRISTGRIMPSLVRPFSVISKMRHGSAMLSHVVQKSIKGQGTWEVGETSGGAMFDRGVLRM